MDFKYKIIDGEIRLYEYIGEQTTSINIPKFISGYPVTRIGVFTFINCYDLKFINDIELTDGINVINNKFILYKLCTYKIDYQIGCDYLCCGNIFFIGGKYVTI